MVLGRQLAGTAISYLEERLVQMKSLWRADLLHQETFEGLFAPTSTYGPVPGYMI